MKSFANYIEEELVLERLSQEIDAIILSEAGLFKKLGGTLKRMVKSASFQQAVVAFQKRAKKLGDKHKAAMEIAQEHGFAPREFQDGLIAIKQLPEETKE